MKTALHVLRGIAGLIVFLAATSAVQLPLHRAHVPDAAAAVVLIAAAAAIYVAWVRLVERRPVRELWTARALPEGGGGLLAGIALFAAVIALLALAGAYHVRSSSSVTVIFAPLLMWIAVAVVEEIAFRGFLFRTVQEAGGTWIALAVSAVFFGFAHAANPGATIFSSFAIAIEAGVLLAIAYACTGRLWLPIGIHAGWNFAEGTIFGVAVSGQGTHAASVLHGVTAGPTLITGGSFGPEASIAAIAVCVLASIALYVLGVKKPPMVEPSAA
jgi:membrane protease YdiL (CAAX protease family)